MKNSNTFKNLKFFFAFVMAFSISSAAFTAETQQRSCTLKNSAKGIIRKDACGTEFCSPIGYKTFSETHPEFASQNHCQWKPMGERCFCLNLNGKPVRAKKFSDLLKSKVSAK